MRTEISEPQYGQNFSSKIGNVFQSARSWRQHHSNMNLELGFAAHGDTVLKGSRFLAVRKYKSRSLLYFSKSAMGVGGGEVLVFSGAGADTLT